MSGYMLAGAVVAVVGLGFMLKAASDEDDRMVDSTAAPAKGVHTHGYRSGGKAPDPEGLPSVPDELKWLFEQAADHRYSDEWIGSMLRFKLARLSPVEPTDKGEPE